MLANTFNQFLLEQVLRTICFMESCFNLVAITLEQYFEIVHPILHKTLLHKIKPAMVIGVCWLLAALYSVPFSIPTSSIIQGNCIVFSTYASPSLEKLAGFVTLVISNVIPALVMIYSFCRMARSLHLRNIRTQPISTTGMFDRTKIKIMKTLLVFIIIFICSWSPNTWIYFLAINSTISYTIYFSWVYQCSVVLLFSSCAINSFVFVVRYKKFKLGLVKCFKSSKTVKRTETFNMHR